MNTIAPQPSAAAPSTSTATQPDRVDQAGRAAADAALAVPGVHHLGSASSRVAAGLRATVTGRDVAPGVRVGRSIDGPTVRISVVADYPAKVRDVAAQVRDAVSAALRGISADPFLVDVVIVDVHGPFDREEPLPDVVEPPKARTVDVGAAAGSAAEAVQQVASDAADTIEDTASNAADTLEDTASNAADTLEDTATKASDTLKRAAADAKDATDDVASFAADAVQAGATAGARQTRDTVPTDASDSVSPERIEIRTADGATTITAGDDVVVVVSAPDASRAESEAPTEEGTASTLPEKDTTRSPDGHRGE